MFGCCLLFIIRKRFRIEPVRIVFFVSPLLSQKWNAFEKSVNVICFEINHFRLRCHSNWTKIWGNFDVARWLNPISTVAKISKKNHVNTHLRHKDWIWLYEMWWLFAEECLYTLDRVMEIKPTHTHKYSLTFTQTCTHYFNIWHKLIMI